MRLDERAARARLEGADHGVLATMSPAGLPHLVPVCFAVVDDLLAVPIDRVKSKSGGTLRRAENLEADPRATLLCERWDADDWSRLWWVRASLRSIEASAGDRGRLEGGLLAKYRQYREREDPFERLLVFRIEAVTGWMA